MNENLRNFIIGVREAGYTKACEPHPYNQNRGLLHDPVRGSGYNELLPLFKGMTFIEQVNGRLRNADFGERLKMLDLGCGRGRFLQDCRDKWPGSMEIWGLNARINFPQEYLREKQNIGIHLKQGDAQQVSSIFKKESMDLVVACRVFPYLPDPFMTLVGVNAVLKEGGAVLITDFPLDPLIGGLNKDVRKRKKFVKHLQGMGIEVRERMTTQRCTDMGTEIAFEADLAFSKIRDMELPLSYSGKIKEVNLQIGRAEEIYTFNALTYKLADGF